MAEVKMGTLYKVTVTEYECGVQRDDPNENDTRYYFTTLEEAEKYKARWEAVANREGYWRAEIRKL
jgi:hypothetical protein